MALSDTDPSSFSNPTQCKTTKIDIFWNINFDKETINGSVGLTVERLDKSCQNLLLDTRDISVAKVTFRDKDLKFSLSEPVKSFGSKLDIELPSDVTDDVLKINIEYETSPKCTALQWMSPEQTAGKKDRYLFSQCQAIHARSLVPCQDTPAVKAPYTAELTHPAKLVGLMSAVKKESVPHPTDKNLVISKFDQKIPIPSYLIAVVVGALEGRKIGPRSTVWSEKETIEAAEYEFAETEDMLATAEELMGPYVWGVYDLLVLPPSFPYGGMENPCLTFVTPTLLAGDRSLANVVAHEIAHSWTGNLVTNKNPEHFWLNEGHTVFVERKIQGRLQGEPFRHFAAMGGWKDLQYQVDVFGEDQAAFTHLVPDLTGVDPDDAFSTVPYEKGSNLLMYLEQKLGGNEVFEGFLKAYIEEFKYKSITTDDWKNFLYQHFSDKKAVLDEVDWDTWFHKPGMPPVKPNYDDSLAKVIQKVSDQWCQVSDEDLPSMTIQPLESRQLRELLSILLEKDPLSQKKIEHLGTAYKLDGMRNSEIRFRWLRLKLRARIEAAIEQTFVFVNEQGRMKFVRPLYRDLYQWDVSKDRAIDNYKENCKYMHTLTATMVGKDLKLIS